MVDRINLILKAKNITARQFAEEIGIQPSGMSHILSGRNRPSLDFVMKVINRYPEIDIKWLTLGEGEMYAPVVAPASAAPTGRAAVAGPAQAPAPAASGYTAPATAVYSAPAPAPMTAPAAPASTTAPDPAASFSAPVAAPVAPPTAAPADVLRQRAAEKVRPVDRQQEPDLFSGMEGTLFDTPEPMTVESVNEPRTSYAARVAPVAPVAPAAPVAPVAPVAPAAPAAPVAPVAPMAPVAPAAPMAPSTPMAPVEAPHPSVHAGVATAATAATAAATPATPATPVTPVTPVGAPAAEAVAMATTPQLNENRMGGVASVGGSENQNLVKKRIVKVVVLYDDHSFSEYYPE